MNEINRSMLYNGLTERKYFKFLEGKGIKTANLYLPNDNSKRWFLNQNLMLISIGINNLRLPL